MILGLNNKDYYDFIFLLSKKEHAGITPSENGRLMGLIAQLWRRKRNLDSSVPPKWTFRIRRSN